MADKGKGKGKGGIQVLRIQTLARIEDKIFDHNDREIPVASAREVPEGEPATVDLGGDREGGRAVLDAALARRAQLGRKAGRAPHHGVEFVFQGAGQYGSGYEWDRLTEKRFERDCLAWARDVLGPESVIVNAAAHRDELTHHLHVVAVPIQDGKLGWCAVRDAALGRIEERARAEAQAAGLPEPKHRKGTRRYSVLQDDFQAQVGTVFGLDRGDRASGRVHEAIDRAKGVEARARLARGEAERLERESHRLERRQDQLERDYGTVQGAVGELEEQRDVLTGEVRGLTAEVKLLDREREEARKRRQAELDAVTEAREQREREEEIAGGFVTGRRSKAGRAIVAGFEEQIATVTGERDEARKLYKQVGLAAVELEAERNTARTERDTAREERDEAQRKHGAAVDGLDRSEKRGERKGRAEAREWAGKLVRRLLVGLGVAVGPETAAGRFVAAVERGNPTAAEQVVGDVERGVSVAPGKRAGVRRSGPGPSI